MPGDSPIAVRLAEASDGTAWDDYVDAHPSASIYHRFVWRSIIDEVFQRQTYFFLATSGEQIVGVLPLVRLKSLVFGDFLVSMPYVNYGGILADDENTVESLLEACCSLAECLEVDHVELRHTSETCKLEVRNDKISMRLDLPDSAETLWKAIGSKLRSQVKRPLREGASAVNGGEELLDEFYSVFSAKYRDLGVPVYPKRWFSTLLRELADAARVFVVRIDSRPVAASVVIRYRDVLEVPWASSLRAADRFSVNMQLYWNMFAYAIESGCNEFDFGRSTEGSGTHRFKKQWGASPRQLYWHYWLKHGGELPRLNLDNSKYRLAAGIWRRMPLWLTNQVGPRVVRNLP